MHLSRVIILLSSEPYRHLIVTPQGNFNFVTDAAKRKLFVKSAIRWIKDYGFDGMSVSFYRQGVIYTLTCLQ